jgi:amino acid transporter
MANGLYQIVANFCFILAGVSGLIKRLSFDRVLPSFLAYTNNRGAAYAAIICFVGVSMSLFLAIFDPADPTAINNFGGVFAISFLSVLVAFASAAVLLKLHRSTLARLVIAQWWQIFVSLGAVFIGLIGELVAHGFCW